MVKYSKNQKPSDETTVEAMKIARATQRPGQTKEQTKLIANGIQKGIDQYKRQHKAKVREMNKRKRKSTPPSDQITMNQEIVASPTSKGNREKLPWILLILSWALFAAYLLFTIR
ncbi:MAG: DUF2956 domain-containing protein [Candidatus Thiodiazotropha sp. (ex Rostrolucina anterorostrata)]|nr:DUF2956 domain-containing protein [Candidatus Thiodiazotropha sp. (ex Rostrolucina anterorostrata)]